MELKKWMAVMVVGIEVAGGLVIGGAGPATAPPPQPAVTNAQGDQGASDNSNNNNYGNNNFNNNNNRRNSRRGRGNNRDSSVTLTATSDPYAVLQTRSIFIKGNQVVAGNNGPRTPGDNMPRGIIQDRQASALIFNGVILVNDEAEALVEDTVTGNVVRVRAGDPVSGGRVTAITFGDLSYAVGGQIKHVELGQNFEGQAPSFSSYGGGSTTMPTSMPAGGAPAFGGPTPPPGASMSNLSPDDILARLKARRAAESAGGK